MDYILHFIAIHYTVAPPPLVRHFYKLTEQIKQKLKNNLNFERVMSSTRGIMDTLPVNVMPYRKLSWLLQWERL
jgi:hypothetical protein